MPKGKADAALTFVRNPITVQSAGDLTVSERMEFFTETGGAPTLIAAGQTYTVNRLCRTTKRITFY